MLHILLRKVIYEVTNPALRDRSWEQIKTKYYIVIHWHILVEVYAILSPLELSVNALQNAFFTIILLV